MKASQSVTEQHPTSSGVRVAPLTPALRMQLVDRRESVERAPGRVGPPGSFTVDHEWLIVQLEASHGQGLFGFVRRLGLGDAEAADAVQDVLLRLWTELERGATIADPRAWAYRAIYRMAMDEHRFRRRVASLRDRLIGRTPTEPSVDEGRATSDRIAVWAEVDRLPLRQREVLYLRYRSDLPFEDVGAVLGITSSAARSHATQALAALRRRIGTTWDE
jgi:RNA polymerase sigma-70 factor (ECF subfamily)